MRGLARSGLAALLLGASSLAAQASTSTPVLQWVPVPALFPRGAQLIAMPDGYKMPPHFHPTDEHVQVNQGTFLVGMGDKFDLKKATPMAVGDTGTAPAGVHHYAAARGATREDVPSVVFAGQPEPRRQIRSMHTRVFGATVLAMSITPLCGQPALAQVQPFPAGFHTQRIATNGTTLYVRIGGNGTAVVLLHGYGETGDMWSPLAAKLAAHYTVIAPDLRGMGLSARPSGGYDKKTQGHDLAGVLDALKIDKADLVTHDIGNMVGYAFAAEYPSRVGRFVLIDAPLPGVGPWDDIVKSHALWHFSFWGPDAERLVKGRERIYLDRFWNEFSADPKKFPEASRAHYARLYARPGAMHAGFEQFKAFDQDAIDNKAFVAEGKLTMPVLAVGGEKSFGPTMAVVMRAAATNVQEGIVPNSGHWVMEESPGATIALVTEFLEK